jgi:hypothetical protein
MTFIGAIGPPSPEEKNVGGSSRSDFNSKRRFMVRSEGGEDFSHFNNSQRWAKGQVHFPPIGAFQAEHQS